MERWLEASTHSVAIRSALTYATLMAADSSDAQKSLESLFYRWFYHDAPEYCKRETQKKTDKVRKQYNRYKVVIGYLMRFLTNYPPVKSESAADVLKWGVTIRTMANAAVEVAVSKANNCFLTVSAFLKRKNRTSLKLNYQWGITLMMRFFHHPKITKRISINKSFS